MVKYRSHEVICLKYLIALVFVTTVSSVRSNNWKFKPPGPFLYNGLTLIPPCISNYIRYTVWDGVIYPSPNLNGATVEVLEWIRSDFISHFIEYDYLSILELKLNHDSKMGPWCNRLRYVTIRRIAGYWKTNTHPTLLNVMVYVLMG